MFGLAAAELKTVNEAPGRTQIHATSILQVRISSTHEARLVKSVLFRSHRTCGLIVGGSRIYTMRYLPAIKALSHEFDKLAVN